MNSIDDKVEALDKALCEIDEVIKSLREIVRILRSETEFRYELADRDFWEDLASRHRDLDG